MSKPEVITAKFDVPTVLRAGQRLKWQKPSQAGTGRYTYTEPKLVEALTGDGHTPKVTVTVSGSHGYPHVVVDCSCGYKLERLSMNRNGTMGAGIAARYRGHMETIAIPMLVWEAHSKRLIYKGHIAMAHQLVALGTSATQAQRYMEMLKNNLYYAPRFFVVEHGVTKANPAKFTSQPKVVHTSRTLSEAIQYAKGRGIKQGNRGNEVIWHEDAPVKKPTGEASAILNVLERADDPAAILEAIKLADSFLDFADIIQVKKEQAQNRLTELLSVD